MQHNYLHEYSFKTSTRKLNINTFHKNNFPNQKSFRGPLRKTSSQIVHNILITVPRRKDDCVYLWLFLVLRGIVLLKMLQKGHKQTSKVKKRRERSDIHFAKVTITLIVRQLTYLSLSKIRKCALQSALILKLSDQKHTEVSTAKVSSEVERQEGKR